jgi:hypothetical protein
MYDMTDPATLNVAKTVATERKRPLKRHAWIDLLCADGFRGKLAFPAQYAANRNACPGV